MPRKSTSLAPPDHEPAVCTNVLLSFRDAVEIIEGKWKSLILLGLGFSGTMRFGELRRVHEGIPAKTLSKELKELELNGLVERTVLDTTPVTVQYAITTHGRTLEKVLLELREWGITHRAFIRTGKVPKKAVARAAKSAKKAQSCT
mgnify:CR=1 FL=1